MPPIISALLAFVTTMFRHESLRLENLALRHQLAVYQQMIHRPQLRPSDRAFWGRLSRLWSAWQQALVFVQPRTVIAWQKRRFRDHWRCMSRRRCLSGTATALLLFVCPRKPCWLPWS
jgi:hypothetical protein